jgi:divalent metal cation (Fe/Co/Zn/Cd) transporter
MDWGATFIFFAIITGIVVWLSLFITVVLLLILLLREKPSIVKEALALAKTLEKAHGLKTRIRFISPEGKVRLHVRNTLTLPEQDEISKTLQRRIEIEKDYKGRSAIIVHPNPQPEAVF